MSLGCRQWSWFFYFYHIRFVFQLVGEQVTRRTLCLQVNYRGVDLRSINEHLKIGVIAKLSDLLERGLAA